MTPEQKFFIKENVMRMIEADLSLAEVLHIKDGVSRLVVEIVKREWPQHWPTLLNELDSLCSKGETQTEMVMFILLRLVEDVVLLQTLEQPQRRKEIYAALTANMEQIFAFLLQLLERHYKAYVESNGQASQHYKVCQAVLNTFTAFIEWVSMSHIMANDKYLIRCLCHLLSDDRLRLNAAECLLAVVSWKAGKVVDRAQLLVLFDTDMMAPLFQAAEKANAKALLAGEEEHYNFLKKMVQILAELGGQLAAVWIADTKPWNKRPSNLDVYLNALLAFSGHPSQTVNMMTNELWNKFFRHPEISKDEIFQTYIPKWVATVMKKSVKVGYPTRTDHPSCAYSLLDFDTDHEFTIFFAKYRIHLFEGVRHISSQMSPAVPYAYTEEWLKQVLSHGAVLATPCAVDSPAYLELEAISLCLEAILSKLSSSQLETILSAALVLAKACIDYSSGDPTLTSVLLSCISSLFPAITARADAMLLLPMMNKIFACITFTGGAAGVADISKGTQMLRRHGCALLVKMSSRQPRALLPMFDHLQDTIVQMRAREQVLRSEFSTLVEALVLVSNEFANYQTQSAFLKAISEPVCIKFRNLQLAFESPEVLMEFIGLTKPAGAGEASPQHQENRSELQFTLNFIMAVMRRSACPADIGVCRAGGFVISEVGGIVSLRNPAWDVFASVLRHILSLAKTMNVLWSPESIAKFHPDFAKVLEMQEAERNNLCEVGNREENRETKTKTPLSRIQTFVLETFENNYHVLNQLCSSFGLEFYQQPELACGLVGTVFSGLHIVPDFRLRIVNRFAKALVNKCPKSCYSAVLAPILQSFLPYMYDRLTERWKYLATLRESPSFDEDNTDSKEVLDDVVCRHLAREYLDVVKAILTSGGGSDIAVSAFGNSENGENQNDNAATVSKSNGHGAPQLSELGALVLQHEALGQGVIMTLVEAVQWPDSLSSIRASNLLELVLPPLVRNGRLGDADAQRIYYSILRAIHELGRHEGNYIALMQLAIMAYETMRPKYPVIADVLAQVPGCNQEDLKRFDQRIMQAHAQGLNPASSAKSGEKAKKDMFKKLIAQFIVKDVSNLFKHDVVIKNLPCLQLLKPPRQKTPSVDETEKSDIGIGALFGSATATANGR